MTEGSTSDSALSNFSAVPRRAFSDRRLKARHLRVLGAVCVAVDRWTGAALISQNRISHHAGIARQKVGPVVTELETFGYIEMIRRGRTQGSRYKTIVYKIVYDQAGTSCTDSSEHHATPVGDMDRVTPGGGITVSPSGVTESDLQKSNLSFSVRPSRARAAHCAPADASAGGTSYSRIQRERRRTQSGLAKAKAEHWERTNKNEASQRLCAALLKVYPDGEWLNLLTSEQLEAATGAEQRNRGAGIKYAQACLKSLETAALPGHKRTSSRAD